jgi:hypothetical protein
MLHYYTLIDPNTEQKYIQIFSQYEKYLGGYFNAKYTFSILFTEEYFINELKENEAYIENVIETRMQAIVSGKKYINKGWTKIIPKPNDLLSIYYLYDPRNYGQLISIEEYNDLLKSEQKKNESDKLLDKQLKIFNEQKNIDSNFSIYKNLVSFDSNKIKNQMKIING